MKRRLSEMSDVKDVKTEPDDLQQTVATLVAQQVAAALLAPLSGGSTARFGRVAFREQEQQSVGAFLHQKLGKDSLARRPGPGGRKLTYIESCKAIELANRAFGFNGWSCHIVECKEEYVRECGGGIETKEKKGDRWSIGYSALVRIELKDGTSHEDVGFGTSDGQRDLGAALEQAKKASISDARKRALRLFGEYLGNSCYDKDHIKDVNSNKPMAPLAAAPNVILPGQQQQGAAAAQAPIINRQPRAQNGPQPPPQNQLQAQQQRPPQTIQHQQQVQQSIQHPQPQQQQRQPIQQQRPQTPQQSIQQQQQRQPQQQQQQRQPQQPQQWKPPQVLRNPHQMNGNSSMQVANSRASTMQTATSSSTNSGHEASTSTAAPSSSSSPFCPQPQRWVSSNAPPPPRMMTSNYPPTIVKTEHPATVQAQSNAQYNMDDLSLSQFDYDPNAESSNPAKKMRS
ncbi:DNA repair and recombination protein rti1 [Phytophthora nicotianae]|uniref:DNA repair and recombination protein rti1 n=1 Tax=Phytophthora nicotianae TaxID=4792 RepID=A0A0W8D3T0_PHYNI|nr:DNA repair and recombination protein rti1 [Phytophthora nicotianae]